MYVMYSCIHRGGRRDCYVCARVRQRYDHHQREFSDTMKDPWLDASEF